MKEQKNVKLIGQYGRCDLFQDKDGVCYTRKDLGGDLGLVEWSHFGNDGSSDGIVAPGTTFVCAGANGEYLGTETVEIVTGGHPGIEGVTGAIMEFPTYERANRIANKG